MAANFSGFRPAHVILLGLNLYLPTVPCVIWGFTSPPPSSNDRLDSSPGRQHLKAGVPSPSGPLFPCWNSGQKKSPLLLASQVRCQASQQ